VPKNAPPEARAWWLALAGIALVTAWRIAVLPFSTAELFVDEAQYWLWGQTLEWGYYSKPPLIAWILRASTAMGGSDSPFWIHLPLPLMHASTAILLALIGRRLFGARIGALAGLAYITLPAVALGSLLVSTDTPMLACFALAVLTHLRLTERRSTGLALVLGAATGVGLLAKYAMVYLPVSAALAALALPRARIAWSDAAIATALALALIAPNLVWNATHDFATLHHTADNSDFQGFMLRPVALLQFWAGQFGVSGPMLFAAYLFGLGAVGRSWPHRYLAAMSLPVFAIVSLQALQAGANANWAAAGHVGAVVIGAAWLAGRRRWLIASFAVNGLVSLALPVATVFSDSWRVGSGNLVLERYVGMGDVSLRAADIAQAEGVDTIVASDRAFLADLFYTLRNSDLALYARPVAGFPPHHYAQEHSLPEGPGDVLYLSRDGTSPCPDAVAVADWQPELGFHTEPIVAFRAPRSCFFPPPSP
jgi:lipid A galacturonosyltransferase RgtD